MCLYCGHSDTDGFLLDYCDGTDFKKNSLQLIFYYDNVDM